MFVAWIPALFSACGDLDTTQPVDVTATEALPALEFRAPVPALPDLVRAWGGGFALDGALAEWEGSWALPAEEGRAVRDGLHRAVAPILAVSTSAEAVEQPAEELDRAVTAVEALIGGDLPTRLLPFFDEARAARNGAMRALAGEDLPEAIRQILVGADALRSASTAGVAHELLKEAEARLRRISGDDSYDAQTTGRAERLVVGARAALDEGASVTALRRAWYAVQLMDGPGER